VAQHGFRHCRQRVGAVLREAVFVCGRYRGNVICCLLISLFALSVQRGVDLRAQIGDFAFERVGESACRAGAKTAVAGLHMVNFRVLSDSAIIPVKAYKSESYITILKCF
jgi:hypothetical protein